MDICLTIDSDWASPEVTDYAIGLLADQGIPFTFFATDDQSPTLPGNAELGLHPNFCAWGAEEELTKLTKLFPKAVGLRPHRLTMPKEDLAATLNREGIAWISSCYEPACFKPLDYGGIPNVPINWGDNLLFNEGREPGYLGTQTKRPGITVWNFHPVHLFLNTASAEQFAVARECYNDPDRLIRLRNKTRRGVEDVLRDVINELEAGLFATISDALEKLTC